MVRHFKTRPFQKRRRYGMRVALDDEVGEEIMKIAKKEGTSAVDVVNDLLAEDLDLEVEEEDVEEEADDEDEE
jgi:hypothetical protein